MTTPESSPTRSRIESSPLYNPDLAPTSRDLRHWGTYNFAALWISMSVNILTYMLAASLIQGGMNWKQAVLTIFLGNLIVLAPMLLNSQPGAKYGIPFPVLARASFGVLGANVAVDACPGMEEFSLRRRRLFLCFLADQSGRRSKRN